MGNTNNKYELSWKAVFDSYGVRDMLNDLRWPCLMAIVLTVLTSIQTYVSKLDIIERLCDIIINILPDLISILIGAFAIWISFFLTSKFKGLSKDSDGRDVLNGLNASFLLEICMMLFSLLFVVVVDIFKRLDYSACECFAEVVNITTLFFLYLVCLNSIWLLKDIAKNLHNVARFAMLYNVDETVEE